jgi:flagellar basal-body rod protein FlgB
MLINYEAVINKLVADLDIKVLKSNLIASNVANVDTPGYKSKSLEFEQMLDDEIGSLKLKTTNPKHMNELSGGVKDRKIVENPNPGRPDGNNVNIDEEMLKLTKNNIQYNIVVQLLSKRLKHLREAVEQTK